MEVPGSKSITARALYLAAVADSPSIIRGALDARDTRLFAAALEVMGARVEDEGADLGPGEVGLPGLPPGHPVPCPQCGGQGDGVVLGELGQPCDSPRVIWERRSNARKYFPA